MGEGDERPGELETAHAVAESPRRRLAMDLTPLRQHREFRYLWLGKGISYFGSQVTRVAIPFQVFRLTHSSFAVGLVAMCELVPILTLSLWGGAAADALDRRKVLIRSDLLLTLCSLALAANAFVHRPSLAVLFVIAVVQAAIYTFGRPALDAAIPRLVPPEQMPAAGALAGLQGTAGGILGPAAGGALIAAFGVPTAKNADCTATTT